MFKNFFLIIFSIFTLLIVSCNKSEELPDKSRTDFHGNLDVSVTRPISGPGPNMLVHIYISENQFINRIPYASGKTDNDGLVSFKKIPAGSWFVDCTIPFDTTLYDSTRVGVIKDQTTFVALELQPR